MSNHKKRNTHALSRAPENKLSGANISVAGLLEKLPNWALVPVMVVVFGLLITDLAVIDPLPFVDEAALLWALMSGMRVLGARRQPAKGEEAAEPEIVVCAAPLPSGPEKPLYV